jgi:hypothetical protein
MRIAVGRQWELRATCRQSRRSRPGESSMDLPFRVEYLDAERLLPVLVRKAA